MVALKRWIVASFLVAASHTAQAEVSLKLNNFLSQADESKIRRAVDIINRRAMTDRVTRCVSQYTTRSKFLDNPLEDGTFQFTHSRISLLARSYSVTYNIRPDNPHYTLVINGESMADSVNGRAAIGISYGLVDKPRFEIALNRNTVRNRSADAIAGTIFHEILHNAGLRHGSSGSYEEAYEGYMIKEWGLCLAGNGERGFGLSGDPYEYNHE